VKVKKIEQKFNSSKSAEHNNPAIVGWVANCNNPKICFLKLARETTRMFKVKDLPIFQILGTL